MASTSLLRCLGSCPVSRLVFELQPGSGACGLRVPGYRSTNRWMERRCTGCTEENSNGMSTSRHPRPHAGARIARALPEPAVSLRHFSVPCNLSASARGRTALQRRGAAFACAARKQNSTQAEPTTLRGKAPRKRMSSKKTERKLSAACNEHASTY